MRGQICMPTGMGWRRRVLLLGVASWAQAAMGLDLSAAYDAALIQDSTVRAARGAAEAGRERLPQARSQWLPSLSLSISRNKSQLDASTSNAIDALQETQSNYYSQNQSLTLRQTLFNKTKEADYKLAGFQVADSNAQLARETLNLVTRISEAYFVVLLAQDQLALLLAQEAMTRTQLDAARKMLLAGSGTRTDIDEVQARLDLNAAQLLEARQNLDYTRQQLAAMVGQPVEHLAPLDVARLSLRPPEPATLAQWQSLAELNSPEIAALRAREEAARIQIDKSRAGHFPVLDIVAQWSSSDRENVTNLNSNYTVRSLGLLLTMPLYTGGYVDSLVRQAIAEQAHAVEVLEATRRDLNGRVHKEYRGVTEGVLRVKALEQAVRSAEQVVISSRKSVLAGVRTRLDVLKAETSRIETERDLAQARYGYLLSRVRLAVLAGLAGRATMDEANAALFREE